MTQPVRRRPGRVSDEELLAAAAISTHMFDLLTRLGIAAYGGNYESIRRRLHRLQALEERFLRRRPSTVALLHTYSDEELRQALDGAISKADVLRALGVPADTAHYPELNRRLRQSGLDASHLRGRAWSRARRDLPRLSIAEVLERASSRSTHQLKLRLISEGVFERCCSSCRLREWQAKPIPLELDHINGDRRDNRLENLRLLCPNCHAQTDTYRGRNIGKVIMPVSGSAV